MGQGINTKSAMGRRDKKDPTLRAFDGKLGYFSVSGYRKFGKLLEIAFGTGHHDFAANLLILEDAGP